MCENKWFDMGSFASNSFNIKIAMAGNHFKIIKLSFLTFSLPLTVNYIKRQLCTSIASDLFHQNTTIKVTKSATMNFFRKIFFSLSFLIIDLSYVFTINMLATAEKCMEK